MSEKIVAFFDVDGTLHKRYAKDCYGNSAHSVWDLISKHYGVVEQEKSLRDNWFTKKPDRDNAADLINEVAKIFKSCKLSKRYFDYIIGSVEFYPGVSETFEELKNKNIITAVISGGFEPQVARVARSLKMDCAVAAFEPFWNDDGHLSHWNLRSCDYDGKSIYADKIMKRYDVEPGECMFVGNGKNDVSIAQKVGVSIAYNGVPELQEVCTYVVNQPDNARDFREVLRYILGYDPLSI